MIAGERGARTLDLGIMRANLPAFQAIHFPKVMFLLDHALPRLSLYSAVSAQIPAQ
jgi:hypothetical protein